MLTLPYTEILQGGRGVEVSPASERPTTDRSDDGERAVRNGIALGGK